MNPTVGFVGFLVLTVALLGAVVWTGFKARRKVHLWLVLAAVISLCVTIYFAEQLGKLYDLEAAGWVTPVHLWIAKVATLSFLLPVISGLGVIQKRVKRGFHRSMAYFAVLCTLLAAGSGVAMIVLAEPL